MLLHIRSSLGTPAGSLDLGFAAFARGLVVESHWELEIPTNTATEGIDRWPGSRGHGVVISSPKELLDRCSRGS